MKESFNTNLYERKATKTKGKFPEMFVCILFCPKKDFT